jgi:hypothetical protein
MRLSSRMNSPMSEAIKADRIHGWGERVISSGDLSVLSGFEFNHKLSLDDALPLNINNCVSVEAGKVSVDIPAFRLRKKKNLPADATHYRLVSCLLTIDFDKRTYRQDIQESELQAMGRKAGTGFCIEQLAQPDNEQGCFWLMGIEFYKMKNDRPVLVKGGALRMMEWIKESSPAECANVVPEVVEQDVTAKSLFVHAPTEVEVDMTTLMELAEAEADTAAILLETFWEAVDAAGAATPPEQGMLEVDEPGATASAELVVDEAGEMQTTPTEEFEKSLRVLLPVNGGQRREMQPNEENRPTNYIKKTHDNWLEGSQ